MLMNRKKIFKPVLAFVLAFITLMGATPLSSFAQVNSDESVTEPSSPFIYIDGEKVPLNDKRIQNTVIIPAKIQTRTGFALSPERKHFTQCEQYFRYIRRV